MSLMKKTAENRYPHSATLFKFCKEAMEIRYEGNVKVIDQDVGAILGYDPADCSHWKKGKKNIRSLATLKSIADHLHIDERLLIDIVAGKIGLEEAIFEFKGYGEFSIQGAHFENFKKEYFKNPSRWQKDNLLRTFEELFDIDRENVVKFANSILSNGDFKEAPIYLPEVFRLFENVELVGDENLTESIKAEFEDQNGQQNRIVYKSPDMRPYVRFLAAKYLFKHLCTTGYGMAKKFQNSPDEILEVQSNIFASVLLIPAQLLKKEVEKVDSSFDVVQQLADIFWVSKGLMNKRLSDYMEFVD